MRLPVNLKTIIAISTIVPTLLISISLVVTGKERPSSNRLLGALFFCITLLTVSTILLSNYKYVKYFPVAHLLNLLIILLGPLFYLFVKSCLERYFEFKKLYFLFFLPFLIVFSYFLYKTMTFDLFYGKHNNQTGYKIIESVQNAIFFILVPIVAVKNNVSLLDFFFNFKNLKLTWIRFLFFSLIIIWINKLFTTMIFDLYNNANFYLKGVSLYFVFIGCFFSITMYVIMNREHFFFPGDKYKFSSLSDNDKKKYFNQLMNIMEEKQCFLDPELTLFSLSDLTGIPAKILSQIINEKTGLHFNEFINGYRIEYSCSMLEDPNNKRSILYILLESGFNSKSTFNSTFKKIKGTTPLLYKNKVSSYKK